jgi:hypothetical protein
MDSRHPIRPLLAHAIGFAMLFGAAAFAGELAPQTSESGGIMISVKPVDVSAAAGHWSFKVSLDSVKQDLKDDLMHTAYLVNRGAKKNEVPVAWKGDAAGGRHREGVLGFNAMTPPPTAIELRIQRVGEKAPRLFRWDLDCPCNDPKMHPS